MAKEFKRADRVGDYLQQELAQLIAREVRDPRVGMVDVTAVELSRDMGHAKVYVTLLGAESDEEIKERIEALNRTAGFLRSKIAKGNAMRTTPSLRFKYDESIQRGSHLSHLIDELVDKDRKAQEARGESLGSDTGPRPDPDSSSDLS